jgi:hypothetical protein
MRLSQDALNCIEARKRHRLSHAHVQMARELGMNPKKLGKLDNHRQEPWKAPLPQFIEDLYFKRFGKERPEIVMSIEERTRAKEAKRAVHKEARRRESSALDYRETDELTVSDFVACLGFRRGALEFRADYIRGRRMKTEIIIRSDGSVTLTTIGRGKAPLRWLERIQGKTALRVID